MSPFPTPQGVIKVGWIWTEAKISPLATYNLPGLCPVIDFLESQNGLSVEQESYVDETEDIHISSVFLRSLQ